MIGRRFGRLVVLKEILERRDRRIQYECLCDCGNIKNIVGKSLRTSRTTSCGCLHKESVGNINRSHGMSENPAYQSWRAMRGRCLNKNNAKYPDYGGRGIKICDRWLESFQNFYDDMGERPKGLTLDRRENDGDYEPNNCKWSTPVEQANNRRKRLVYLHNEDGTFMRNQDREANLC